MSNILWSHSASSGLAHPSSLSGHQRSSSSRRRAGSFFAFSLFHPVKHNFKLLTTMQFRNCFIIAIIIGVSKVVGADRDNKVVDFQDLRGGRQLQHQQWVDLRRNYSDSNNYNIYNYSKFNKFGFGKVLEKFCNGDDDNHVAVGGFLRSDSINGNDFAPLLDVLAIFTMIREYLLLLLNVLWYNWETILWAIFTMSREYLLLLLNVLWETILCCILCRILCCVAIFISVITVLVLVIVYLQFSPLFSTSGHCSTLIEGVTFPSVMRTKYWHFYHAWNISITFLAKGNNWDLFCFATKRFFQSLPGFWYDPLRSLHGLPKTNERLIEIQTSYIKSNIKNRDLLPDNYQYFGNTLPSKTSLKEFARSNAFFTSIVKHVESQNMYTICTRSKSGMKAAVYQINSYEANEDSATFFSDCIATYDVNFPRINVTLDENLDIISVEVYDHIKGKFRCREKIYVDNDEHIIFIDKLLLLASYYFQSIHTCLHVYHPLMVETMVFAAKDYPALATFVEPYRRNEMRKLFEVKAFLVGDNGALVGSVYKGDPKKVPTFFGKLVKCWGSCTSSKDFIKKFLLKGFMKPEPGSPMRTIASVRKELAERNILTEFFKHTDLIPGVAKQLDNVFRKQNPSAYRQAMQRLEEYSNDTGPNGIRVNNFQTWFEMVTITGILHGLTHSGTRLCTTMPVFGFFNGPTFNTKAGMFRADGFGLTLLLGTITGIEEDQEISEQMCLSTKSYPELQKIAVQYAQKTNAIKQAYYESVRNSEEFDEKGWIWGDYFPGTIDNRQFSNSTYH